MLNILVIEDDQAAAAELMESLRLMGHSAEWSGGQTPLKVGNSCDLVLLDLGLGTNDGFAILEQIAAGSVRPPVAIVSGSEPRIVESANELALARGIRMIGTLYKPVSADRFVDMLDRLARLLAKGPVAIDHAAVSPFYVFQPKYDLRGGQVVGYEVLLRLPGVASIEHWFAGLDPDRSLAMTVAAAEVALGLRAQLARQGLPLTVGFNCPPDVFGEARFLTILRRLTARLGLDPALVAIELTEQRGDVSAVDLASMASRYTLAGYQVHLDDFGAGTASLDQILRLPLNEVKIDRKLFRALSDGNGALLREIVAFCRAHGIRSTIEGIETAADLAIARRAGADSGQGYYWGMPTADVITLQ